jgi:hypothetical protein
MKAKTSIQLLFIDGLSSMGVVLTQHGGEKNLLPFPPQA